MSPTPGPLVVSFIILWPGIKISEQLIHDSVRAQRRLSTAWTLSKAVELVDNALNKRLLNMLRRFSGEFRNASREFELDGFGPEG